MTHIEFSRKGGLTMTPEKLEALRINAAKARAAFIKNNKDARRMKRSRARYQAKP